MTTIDQSALSLAAARNPKKGVANDDGHGAAKQEKGARSFGDLIQDAKQKLADAKQKLVKAADMNGAPAARATAEIGATAEIEDVPEQPIVEPGQKAPPDVSGRVRIATNFQQLLRTSNDSRAVATAVAEGSQKSDRTTSTTDKKADAQKTKAADIAAQEPAISSSEQLSILLGLGVANDADAAEEPAVAASDDFAKKPGQDEETVDVADQDRLAEKASVSIAIDVLKEAAGQMQAASRPIHQDNAGRDPGTDDAESDGDAAEIVRLVSKDGKGVPVDVPLAERTSVAEADTPALPGKNSDFVTVLESRRYLGFSSDTNTTVLTNAIKSDPTWSQALSAVTSAQNAIEGNTSTTVNTLKLQMNPESLGSMTASLRLKGEALTVEVKVETIEAYRQLSGDHDQIVKALKDQGFAIDQVTIQLSAPEKAGQSQDSGGQQQNGQDSREGLGQNARQREDNERRTGNRNFWQNNEQTSDPGDIARTSDDDDIYL